MIARVMWFVMLLGVAIVTIGVQLDRQARVSPALASAVPEQFRAFAQSRIAARAVVAGEPQRALTEAELLVARRPIPAEHLRLLASAQFEAEQVESGSQTVQIAAQRGWRDPLAQQAMLELALAVDDGAEAARRYAALLLNGDTDNALLSELGSKVFSEQGEVAHDTFADIVNGGTRWHDFFLRRGARVMPSEAFVAIIGEAKERGSRFECQAIDRTVQQLGNRDPAAAEQLRAAFVADC